MYAIGLCRFATLASVVLSVFFAKSTVTNEGMFHFCGSPNSQSLASHRATRADAHKSRSASPTRQPG